jgi:hypothetical protein
MALAACVATPEEVPGGKLLAEADSKLAAEDYTGAISSYSAFVTASPQHTESARARATQKALERLLAAQTGMGRAQQGTDATRRELAEKQAEADRLRGEVTKLRADLERLRSIDLPARTK